MSSYTQQKFSLGTTLGQTWGTTLWPSLRTSPGWRGIAPMLLGGIDAPGSMWPVFPELSQVNLWHLWSRFIAGGQGALQCIHY